jgi:hypothetical protein
MRGALSKNQALRRLTAESLKNYEAGVRHNLRGFTSRTGFTRSFRPIVRHPAFPERGPTGWLDFF